MWENVGFPLSSKICRKLLIYGVAIILLGISIGVAVGLSLYQVDVQQIEISIAISIIITIVNFAMEYTIYFLSFYENEFNKTAEQASIAFKISISQLFNSIGVPILVAYITNKKILSAGGLVDDVFWVGLFTIIAPIGRFIDPYNIFLNCKKSHY